MVAIDDSFPPPRRPTAHQPLLGQTMLLVEDSRTAGEAMRLICTAGGARLRRAASLAAAERHLRTYRPTVAMVDLGLPDGSGLDLIARLHAARPRVVALIAVSGDPGRAAEAQAAGADGFIAKPLGPVAQVQNEILMHLPPEMRPAGPRRATLEAVPPDPEALSADLGEIESLLVGANGADLAYAVEAAAGLGRLTGDSGLADLGRQCANEIAAGTRTSLPRLLALVASRRAHATGGAA